MLDFSAILSPLLQYWWILPLIFLILFFKTPFAKGLVGEAIVNFGIKVLLDKSKYHLIKNVTLPTEDGTTQIDHIIVSEYGVFVIETKNMNGWIFGGEHQKIWTQNLYKHKHKFQNPLHQNYKHCKTIENALGLGAHKIFSVVVFVGDATFKTKMPENVTYSGGLFRYIKSKTNPILSMTEVNSIIAQLESGRLSRTYKTHKDHTSHVKEIIAKKNSESLCPRCGSALVLRVAKQGANAGNQFYGCKSYPRCKYTTEQIA